MPIPSELRIVKFQNDPGFYLLYLDDGGNELTDTYHENLERALEQGNWEFNVKPDEWEVVDPLEPLSEARGARLD